MSQTAAAEAEQRDTGYAPERWEFDGEVARVFDDMLRRSIPQYEIMRGACYDLGRTFVRPRATILDLGCARGEALAPFVREYGVANRYVGVELSEPMLAAARAHFAGEIAGGVAEISACDLRREYPDVGYTCLTLCVLTLQFIPIEYRQRLVRQIRAHTLRGGALILVEKILGDSAELDQRFVELYYGLKRANGYSQEEIDRKRLALEGRLVPVTAKWNEDLLRQAGFEQIDCFWRWANFAGWLAVREED